MELIDAFRDATGVSVPYEIVARRDGDVPAIWADATSAAKVLNWRAKVPLSNTLQSAWRWQINSGEKKS